MDTAKELGEHKIIQLIQNCLDVMPNMPVPFGDDVSALDIGNEKLVVANTDMLVAKTDVPKTMTLWQAARKAVVMTISDLAAKGVQTQAVLASVGLPPELTKEDILQIGKGLNAGARENGAYIVGGDTNEASDVLISCTALGVCEKTRLIRRDGAKVGDIVAVTGVFGKTSAGLRVLVDGFSVSAGVDVLVDSVLLPHARVKEGVALAQCNAVTASIDVSDGLGWSLHELSRASNVGFCLDQVPVSPEAHAFALLHGLDQLELALYGGEEYELLVSIKPDRWADALSAVETVGGELLRVGVVTKTKQVVLKTGEETVFVEARGWEHFKTE
ncbi:MAG: thiamine-phosphate kinase [Candidatus Bathyarchaeia archaeon]